MDECFQVYFSLLWCLYLWNKKLTNKTAPQLNSLPPTTEILVENIKRAHYQAAIWKNSDKLNPSPLDPCDYGWYKDEDTRCLLPVMIPSGIKAAPSDIHPILVPKKSQLCKLNLRQQSTYRSQNLLNIFREGSFVTHPVICTTYLCICIPTIRH